MNHFRGFLSDKIWPDALKAGELLHPVLPSVLEEREPWNFASESDVGSR